MAPLCYKYTGDVAPSAVKISEMSPEWQDILNAYSLLIFKN